MYFTFLSADSRAAQMPLPTSWCLHLHFGPADYGQREDLFTESQTGCLEGTTESPQSPHSAGVCPDGSGTSPGRETPQPCWCLFQCSVTTQGISSSCPGGTSWAPSLLSQPGPSSDASLQIFLYIYKTHSPFSHSPSFSCQL